MRALYKAVLYLLRMRLRTMNDPYFTGESAELEELIEELEHEEDMSEVPET